MITPSLEFKPVHKGKYTLLQHFAIFIHHVIAHPLTFLTGDSAWSWRLHDWAFETATNENAGRHGVHTCPHLSLRQKFAAFIHDVVSHPLIFFSRDAVWAWRLHDWSGYMLQKHDDQPSQLVIEGPNKQEAAEVLETHGFQIIQLGTVDEPLELHVTGFGSHKAVTVLAAHGIDALNRRPAPKCGLTL